MYFRQRAVFGAAVPEACFCLAGKGRTGIMMMIYDMMRNPGVPMKDIVIRQTMAGSSYPLYTEKSNRYKVPLYEEKARMMPLIYEYVQENRKTNYKVPWSLWLKKKKQIGSLI